MDGSKTDGYGTFLLAWKSAPASRVSRTSMPRNCTPLSAVSVAARLRLSASARQDRTSPRY